MTRKQLGDLQQRLSMMSVTAVPSERLFRLACSAGAFSEREGPSGISAGLETDAKVEMTSCLAVKCAS